MTDKNRIWTHYMKHIEFHEDFKPQGCFNGSGQSKQMAAILGAGVQDGELFAEMANHNAIAVDGTSNVRTHAKIRIQCFQLRLLRRMLALSDGLAGVDTVVSISSSSLLPRIVLLEGKQLISGGR